MTKPIAIVRTERRRFSACVEVWTNDTDAGKAAREAAIAEALVSDWCEAASYGVRVRKPAGLRFGGGAEADAVAWDMARARDAAKAKLRELGYVVRATQPATAAGEGR